MNRDKRIAELEAARDGLRAALIPLLAGAVEEYVLSLPDNLRTKYGELMRLLIKQGYAALAALPEDERG